MASLLTDLVKSRVDKLIDGAIGELRYVCCFTSIVKEFEEELPRLEAGKSTMKQHIDVQTRNGNNIAPNANQWVAEADKLIQEDIETKNKCFFGFCPDCVRRYKRGKELANKIEKMKQLVEDGKILENIGIPRPPPDVGFHSSQDYIPLESRESKYTELLEALKDENSFITGLYGMGGAGKTTLAREVGKQLKETKIFDLVIDTTVSNAPNIKKIQDEIAGLLDLKWEDCPESLRPRKLRDRLTTDGQKILVILDDVWDQNPIDFDAIGIPRRDTHKGCRVLVTTRDEQVLRKMGCDATIKLEVLSDDDAWKMFDCYAGISISSPQNLIEKGRKIADECKRLPIAIKVVASSLKGQHHREHEWNAILKSLKKPVSMHNVDDDLVDVYKCLRYSYDYLKDEKAKRLFLLCSGFPEDAKIDSEILTRLAIGAGLFGEDYVSYDETRDQVFSAKNKLLDSCLLEAVRFHSVLVADERYVKMHDLVRDAAQWIANEEIRTINMSHKDPKSFIDRVKNTKYLFLKGKVREMFSSNFGGSKLEILIASFNMDGDGDCVELPNSFFENMAGLRALHLDYKRRSYTHFGFSLPISIQSLMNIRSLLVTKVDLGDISVLGNLQCLETLDLNSCKITELPHEITELKKFKLLKLEDCEIKKKNPFEVIGRCISLEELYFINSFNDFCREISLPTLQRLQRYDITNQSYIERVVYSRSKVVEFRQMDVDVVTFSEATLKSFIQTTEVLALQSIQWRWRNIIPEIVPVDQSKNDLVKLSLDNISELQYLINTNDSPVPNVFSKLVVLTLYNMKNLEELCNGPISFDSLKELQIKNCVNLQSLFKFKLDLCNLKTMKVRKCPLLVSLFQLSTAQSLMMLEELEIGDCEQLESILTNEKRGEESVEEILVDDGDNDNKKGSSMFPKLKALHIRECPQLEFVLPFLCGDLPVLLETISIESCDKLKYIFDKFVKFGPLKKLELGGLPNFIGIFPESGHLMPLFAKGSSSSLRDGFKAQTQLDPIKCNVFSWTQRCCYGLKYKDKLRSTTNTKIPLVSEDQPQHCPISSESNSRCLHIWERAHCFSRQSQILCNITTIELSNVSKIKSVFVLSIARRMLQLETLRIWDCDELKHLIVDIGDDNGGNNSSNVFPRLKELFVVNCEQLEYIFGHCADDHQSNNEIHLHLPELKSLKLENLPSVVAMSPKQYHTTFPSLVELQLNNCIHQVGSKSIGDFIGHASSKCFSGQPQILCNITKIQLSKVSKIKSVFILSTARRMLKLETLSIWDCDELKHIIVDIGDDNGGNSSSNVFPRLKELIVVNCEQLEYIFGDYADDHQSHTEIHLNLPEMKSLLLEDLPNFVAMSPKQYHTTFPSLVKLEIYNCIHQFASKSIGDLMSHASLKELSGNVEHFLTLEVLQVTNTKVEYLFFLNETNGQRLNLMLQYITLEDLHVMTYLFVGPKSSVTLQNLTEIDIKRCEKLEIIFSTSVVRCFPQLRVLRIEKCEELKHIIEDDAEDEMVLPPGTCFPKLETLLVVNCNKLEFVFPVSICKELHKLKVLMIREADALQEIFRSKDAQTVEIPNLKVIVFVNLPSLSQTQAAQFQNVEHRLVENCQKLSLTSVSTLRTLEIYNLDDGLYWYLGDRGLLLPGDSEAQDIRNYENPSAETTKDFATSGRELSSSQELVNNKESTGQQHPLGETDTTNKPSEINNCLEEIKDQSIQEASASASASASTSEKDTTTIMSTNSETRSKPKQESFKTSGEEGTTLDNVETLTSSHEVGYGKISIPSLPTSQTNDQRVKDGNLTTETSKDFSVGVEVQAALGHQLASSQEILNEPSTSQQHPLGETDTTAKPSQGKNCLEETKDQSIQEVLISEKATTTVMQSFKRSDEQGTTSDNVKTVTTSTHLESTFEHKTSLQVKDDEIRVSEPKPSPTNSSLGSQSISTPYEGNPPQIVENPSSSLITRELQQLVSKNHLASENLSLLTDFLVKHPSVRLMDNSLSIRYKGYAYNCLAELLKFLRTHSVQNVLESSRSELVELLQDARRFGFDRGWLDGVERRALFPDLQVSQDVIEKILHFKQQVSQHVEDLKHQLTSSEAVLESVIQQEAQVLESMAALSAPLGY